MILTGFCLYRSSGFLFRLRLLFCWWKLRPNFQFSSGIYHVLPLYISLILAIAGTSAVAFISIGVLIQWSLRKTLPLLPPVEAEAPPQVADQQITEIVAKPPAAPPELVQEIAAPPTPEPLDEPT